MEDQTLQMARRSFGYGRWEAPYWFIGPEQGMGDGHDSLAVRAEAWRELGSGELCDCREFHGLIHEPRWHSKKPRLQPTWRPLMLFLMSCLGRPTALESLRDYQRDHWGSVGGETCVIELSGLAAPALAAPGPHGLFLEERIAVIRERIRQHKPKLVVMYGEGDKQHWEEIAGRPFPPERIQRIGQTAFGMMPHPVSWGVTNEDWSRWGLKLRALTDSHP